MEIAFYRLGIIPVTEPTEWYTTQAIHPLDFILSWATEGVRHPAYASNHHYAIKYFLWCINNIEFSKSLASQTKARNVLYCDTQSAATYRCNRQ